MKQKTDETVSTRNQALAWWNNLPNEVQGKHWFKFRDNNFTPSTNPSNLTGREIEEIYNKEVLEPKRQEEWQESQVNRRYSKPNQKQFKQGDIVKIKNPSFPFQQDIRYKVVKILKTRLHLEETIDKYIYKNIKKSIVILA